MRLEPLRTASLRAAEDDAERLLAATGKRAGAIVRKAQSDAADLLDGARADARQEGRQLATARLAAARREANGLVLGARGAALEQLQGRAQIAAQSLPDDPDYAPLLEHLVEAARSRLDAEDVDVIPVPGGGVLVRADGRQVDLTLASQVERHLHGLGARVEALWT